MDTIKKLSDYAILTGQTQKFLGVPKTIDNDLALTDHTPGFGSAAKYIGASTKEVIRDAEGLTYKKNMITIMEIMGRNAGWLTGATALAKTEECEGPDLIYLPEVPFDIEKFLAQGKGSAEEKIFYCDRSLRGNQAGRRTLCMRAWKRRRLCRCLRTQAAAGYSHLSGQFPGSRVWMQDPCSGTFYSYREVLPIWHPGWILTKHLW